MKPKIAVTRPVFDEVIETLAAHFEVTDNQQGEPIDAAWLCRRLAGQDGVLAIASDRIDAELIHACPGLRMIANIGVGYNNIDVAACSAAGILVSNTPDVLNDTVADMTLALMLAAARGVVRGDRQIREGRWRQLRFLDGLGPDVHHATLGILGMGRIGQVVARRARAFDMDILYHNRNRLPVDTETACGARYRSQAELLREADYLVLLLPYSPASHHLIGAAELAQMKPTAFLINMARGGIVDETALIECLRERRIAGAALDVFENEPQVDPAFFTLDNVVLSPHAGGASRPTRLAMAHCAARNLIAALSGQKPPNLVNPEIFTP